MSIVLNEGDERSLDITLTLKAPPAPEPATLYGYIKDADTGEGIPGATVELVGHYTAVTNNIGYYSITDIEPGTYTVIVSHPDYNDYVA